MSIENLTKTLGQATRAERSEGAASYQKYSLITAEIAEKYGFERQIGAAVFAALSPNNSYHGNLRDVDSLLRAAQNGQEIHEVKVSTYGNNKRKAWRIAHGADPLTELVAPKTRSFYLNVYDPLDPGPVTVDGHMFNCWSGTRINLVGLRTPKSQYEVVAEGVRALALTAGLVPCQLQAVLWLTHRRIHGILTPPQLSLWDADYHAARLGYRV